MFSTGLNNCLPFSSNFKLLSAKSFNLEKSKICGLVMGQLLLIINPSQDDICLDCYHLQKTISTKVQMAHLFFDRAGNIVGKEKNAGYQYFLLFPQYFFFSKDFLHL